MFLLKDFLPTSFANNRSNKRTDVLNECLINEFVDLHPEYSDLNWVTEKEVPDAYGATFKIDAVGYRKGHPVVVLLNKCMNSSTSKNLKNYANTTVGESIRLLFGPFGEKIEKVFFLTAHPRFSPCFKKETGDVTRVEDVFRALKRTQIKDVMAKLHGDRVGLITFTYDIDQVREFSNKSQFEEGITASNIDVIQYL